MNFKCVKCGNGVSGNAHPHVSGCSRGGAHEWVSKFSDVRKSDINGYPKTIYDDGDTKLEVWKFTNLSRLTLLIANRLISKSEIGAVMVKIKGDEFVSLDLPCGMKSEIRNALHGEPFEAEGEDDILATDEFLIIQLGDTIENDIGRLFDENNVRYNKEQYIQFKKDRSAEEDELKKAFYSANATRPMHPNVEILRTKLDELQAFIEAVGVNDDNENSYEEAVETLRGGVDNYFEMIEQFREEIPTSGGTEAEEDAVIEINRRITELNQNRLQKLDEIGYESPEDSRADLFPNGEDED
jgi:hypothetical protein